MAASIQVVLREDVSKVGKTGELVKVKPGFARNFLIPRGLAVVATEASIARIEHEKRQALARAAKLKKSADAIAQVVSALTVQITRATGDEGKLFGSVTSKDVAEALAAKGHDIDKKKLVLPDHIKQTGTYEVTAKLAPEVTATFKLEVVAKA